MASGRGRFGWAVAALAVGAVVVPPPPAAAAAPGGACTQPRLEDLGPYVPVDDDVIGEAFGVVTPAPVTSPFPDTDDDGQADLLTYDSSAHRIDIARGDGTASVTGLPPTTSWPGAPDPAGIGHADLDGDGRDELWVRFRTPGMLGHDETLVISGALPVGATPAASVALSVRGAVIGDVTGDGLHDVEVHVGTTPTPPWPFDATLLGHRSFVGAFGPGPGSPAFPADAPYYGLGADVDLDGQHDVVTIGRDGAPGTLHLTATDTTLSFTAPAPYGAVVFSRDAGTTYLFTTPRPALDGPFHHFRLRVDCALPWVERAGQAVLGRPGTAADLVDLAPDADPTVAQRVPTARALVRSAEGRGHLVDQRFAQVLGRPTDPIGRAWWVTALRQGRRTAQDLTATLFGSGELYRAVGSSPDGWVAALYQRSLGYAPDPAGAAYWKARAAALGRERAAVRFLGAAAARRSLVRAWSLDPAGLGRAATAGEVAAGEAAFAADGWDGFLVWATTTDAYYRLAQAGGAARP